MHNLVSNTLASIHFISILYIQVWKSSRAKFLRSKASSTFRSTMRSSLSGSTMKKPTTAYTMSMVRSSQSLLYFIFCYFIYLCNVFWFCSPWSPKKPRLFQQHSTQQKVCLALSPGHLLLHFWAYVLDLWTVSCCQCVKQCTFTT